MSWCVKVDVLLTPATPAAVAAKNATGTIPIVFYTRSDPVALGLVDSLARPGGNVTGFTTISSVLVGKRLELLKETLPKLSRIAAAKNRLPAIYANREFVASGGLISYGVDEAEPYRRGAVFVDKILKGTKPADLPVEQPKKFELIINLKAAKQIGLTLPPNVVARANKVIR
jgi:ABC-type uncharacterized transport system substrate-binding protein